MYLREMGTVKLLDREGEVRIAKRIEQGEAKIYQALANNPVVLEEILKLLENAGRDSRIVQELVNVSDEDEDAEQENLDDRATRRIEGILGSFRKIGALDNDIKRMKFKARTIKKGTKALARIEASIDQQDRRHGEADPRRRLHAGRPEPRDRDPARTSTARWRSPEVTIRQDTNILKKEKNPTRIDFYKRRIAKYRSRCASSSRSSASRTRTSRRRCAWSARARRRPTRPSTS